jgi:hypothetical protein
MVPQPARGGLGRPAQEDVNAPARLRVDQDRGIDQAPAQCEVVCPRCARKGPLAAGADVDIVVFDPAAITDQATYPRASAYDGHPARPGQRHLRRPRRAARP